MAICSPALWVAALFVEGHVLFAAVEDDLVAATLPLRCGSRISMMRFAQALSLAVVVVRQCVGSGELERKLLRPCSQTDVGCLCEVGKDAQVAAVVVVAWRAGRTTISAGSRSLLACGIKLASKESWSSDSGGEHGCRRTGGTCSQRDAKRAGGAADRCWLAVSQRRASTLLIWR
ncbi:hypothetical protein L1887_58840 [Cichorium endivia]|nr:hypothetical protein L1887_58840 [Cichorium endivia]